MPVLESATASAAKIIFAPMINALIALYSTWRGRKKEDREFREKVFKDQFLPAFTRLEQIHRDYLTSFSTFYELCKKFETPPRDLLAKFRRYGMEYATWREDARCFVGVCRAVAKEYVLKEEKAAIEEFASAIEEYFRVTSPDSSKFAPSWFSSFLNQFEDLVRTGQSPWDEKFEGYGFGSDPKKTFMGYMRTVYETELPSRWTRVSKAKAALQTVFIIPR